MKPFPKPNIPINPILSSLSHVIPHKQKQTPSIIDAKSVKFVTAGRMAIALALEHAKIGKGNDVLIPAYHCSSMVEPVIWSGATPVFYRIKPNTSVDIDDILSKINPNTKLIMATHFFGFPQIMPELKDVCEKHNILLLEDCAHAFFGEAYGQPLGSFGDYAIGSIMKFFPVYDGGCLVSNHTDISTITLSPPSAAFQLKAAINILESAIAYNRLKGFAWIIKLPLAIKDFFWKQLKSKSQNANTTIGPGASEGGYAFEASWIHTKMSIVSNQVFKHHPKKLSADKRRQNYLKIRDALATLDCMRPLHESLPEGVVPYVVPMYVNNPEILFPILKQKGIPIIRFGEFLWQNVNADTCAVSDEYSRHIFQFPCHQMLRKTEISWMLEAITESTKNLDQ